MIKKKPRFLFVAVLLGALIAVAEGFSNLGCASTSSVIITVAGSFAAGAAAAGYIAAIRDRRRNPIPG